MTYKAILFDLDGVLIDSIPVMRISFETAYREVVDSAVDDETISALFEQYCQYLGHGFHHIMNALQLPHEMYAPYVRQSKQLSDSVVLCDGIKQLLPQLRLRGLRLTVATGKDGYRARDLLAKLEIDQYFELVTGSDEIAKPKPAPDMLLYQLDVLKIQPNEAVMVGDAPADIKAGKAAGMTTIGVLWGYGDKETLAGADFFIQHPEELLDFGFWIWDFQNKETIL